MNVSTSLRLYFFAALLFMTILAVELSAQIVITSDDFPTNIGTFIITKDDTVDSVLVDVGLPGENQNWIFDQAFPSVFYRQLVVDATESTYSKNYPDANVVTRYVGKLGNLIHSYYFDDTEGTFYLFQEKTPEKLLMKGIGIDIGTVSFKDFKFNYSGHVSMQPNIALAKFPLQFNDSWESVSEFSIQIDTLLFGNPVTLLTQVHDSIYNIVDGWGTIVLPTASYECLRLKSYITLVEKILINGAELRSRKTRTINYSWFAKNYGLVAKMTSHSNQPEDDFKYAKQVCRLHLFNPQITIGLADTCGAPGDTVDIPISIAGLADLKIQKIKMRIDCGEMIEPMEVLKANTIIENWQNLYYGVINNKFTIEASGKTPLTQDGVLGYLRVYVRPSERADSTEISLSNAVVDQEGPTVNLSSGRFMIQVISGVQEENLDDVEPLRDARLFSNYPNPFNAGTMICYEIAQPSKVHIEIYNSVGQTVALLENQRQDKGVYRIQWDGVNHNNDPLPSGVYFSHLRAIPETDPQHSIHATQKMILLR